MLKNGWIDKVKNTEVLRKISVEEPGFYRNTVRQTMAYAAYMCRGNSGLNVVLVLEGK